MSKNEDNSEVGWILNKIMNEKIHIGRYSLKIHCRIVKHFMIFYILIDS